MAAEIYFSLGVPFWKICIIIADMKISVKNFGPIREAKDIQIAPMTLFVGPSNTGKSYLAVLLYTIAKSFNSPRASVSSQEEIEKEQKLRRLLARKSGVALAQARKMVAQWAKSVFPQWTKEFSQDWKRHTLYYLGAEGEKIIADKNFFVELLSQDGRVVIDLLSPGNSSINAAALNEIGAECIETYERNNPPYSFSLHDAAFRSFFLRRFWAEKNTRWTNDWDIHYLPASRGGVMQSRRALTGAALEQASLLGLPGRNFSRLSPLFPGMTADYMKKLINIPHLPARFRKGPIVRISDDMESGLMKGEIAVRRTEAGYPEFRYLFSKRGKHDISVSNASSMVSELAPVSIFIRYHLDKDNLFIVEEPEAHLHPDGQRIISELLARLANAGVFVLATTHSDIVLEQVSNFVHASRINGTAAAKRRAAKIAGAVLTEKQVAVYSFANSNKRGTVVKKVEFDSEYGVLTSDHLKESTGLYNRTVLLLNGRDDEYDD